MRCQIISCVVACSMYDYCCHNIISIIVLYVCVSRCFATDFFRRRRKKRTLWQVFFAEGRLCNFTPCTTGGTISIFLIKGGGLSKVFATDYSFSRKVRLRARKPIEHTTTVD